MIGRTYLGRYEAQKLLGEGGMGKVYLARQLDLGRQVVVKVMHDHVAADAKFRDRFQRETLLMARFQHPNAVTLYDASLTDPFGPCIVMEYVKGDNLEQLLKRNGRLSAGRVARVLRQLCDVLQAAHDEGIIHRDLKPANIMISEPDSPKERVKVMDFGLAKLIEDGHDGNVTDTTIDFAVGTPGYICPEQVRGEAMDHRGDLYSVGVLMFELLTGRLPFIGANSMDVLLAHATEDPPTYASLGLAGVVPWAVEDLVRQCLAKDPGGRPQSAKELGKRYAAALGLSSKTSADRPLPVAPSGPPAKAAGGTDSEPILLIASPPPLIPEQAPAPARKSSGTLVDKDAVAMPFLMEAYMPESIALMKLKGFVHDTGGEILASNASMVKMRLSTPKHSGAFRWLARTRRADGPVDVELYLRRVDQSRAGHLSINVLFRPSHPSLLSDDGWKSRCSKLFVDLRSYLIGGG